MKNRLILRQLKGLSHHEIKFLPQNKLSTQFRPSLSCEHNGQFYSAGARTASMHTQRVWKVGNLAASSGGNVFILLQTFFFISQPSGGIMICAGHEVIVECAYACTGERTYSMYVGSTHCRWTRWCGFTVVRLFVLCAHRRSLLPSNNYRRIRVRARRRADRSLISAETISCWWSEVRFMTQSICSTRPCPAPPLLQICWRRCSLAW